MNSNRKFLVAGFFAIIAVVAIFYFRNAAKPPKVAEQTKPESFLPIPEIAGESAPIVANVSLAAASAAVLTLQQQVDKYASSGKPQDALAAYKIVWHCIYVRRDAATNNYRNDPNRKPSEKVADACGDLSSSTVAGSYQLLDKAAKAGVHEAAALVADAGEDGMGGTQLSDDPNSASSQAFQKRMEDAMNAGVATGDCGSLMTKVLNLEYSQDNEDALKYLDEAGRECPKQGREVPKLEMRRKRLLYLINQRNEEKK